MSALSDYIASIAVPVAHFSMSETTGSLLSTVGDEATVSGLVARGLPALVAGADDAAIMWVAANSRAATSPAEKWRLGSGDFTVMTCLRYTPGSFNTVLALRNASTVLCAITVGRFLTGDISAEAWGWSSETTRVRSGSAKNDGSPHIVVVRYRHAALMLDLFIDGVAVDSRAQPAGRPTAGSDYWLTIGNNIPGADQGMPGMAQDETAVWAAALSDTQIASISTAAVSGVYGAVGGNVTTTAGIAANAVDVWRWSDGRLFARVTPDAEGDWTASVPPGVYGITYLAADCQPVTHGPYTVSAS